MEHKFRGKRIDNGKWVYGYYLKYQPEPFLDIHTTPAYDAIMEDGNALNKVHPDSVGMWTGLKDKSGVAFDWYEGDLLELDAGASGTHAIFWDDKGACFMCGEELLVNVSGDYNTKVVGNITDNPELLKA